MGKGKYLGIKVIKKHARELRKNLTESEKQLWEQIRNRKLCGYKFLRQHPVIYKADFKGLNYFIADFYCDEKKTPSLWSREGESRSEAEEGGEFVGKSVEGESLNTVKERGVRVEH
ncbi:MAG: DUF559 domain-containing protein [Chitinispirillaceae bacterium]|nr:DUF559 domain-containing protein [Chitinispirillaceae bacterium]